jgi:hypothetical protein
MTTNTWIGQNQLGIRYENGQWVVREDWEDWEIVFTGSYEECEAYVNNRWIAYEESIVG